MKKSINIKNLITSIVLVIAIVFGAVMMISLSDCGKKKADFTWWIPKTDGYGVYYETYEQALAIQWLNEQTWEYEVEKEGGGVEAAKGNVRLGFDAPIAGSEQDSFGTMISSGDYADIMDLTYATDSPMQLFEQDVLIELTEYVEKYMPNYVNYLNANPDVKRLATVTDDNGKTHYYALYTVSDEPNDNFMGYVYRRDWVVAYADVPTHVWDLANVLTDANDPTSVNTSKIHYTDYYEAQANNDWTGWIDQTEVTAFTYADGDDPDNTYSDNVIFPSGKNKPLYISDWEWMFRAFKKAIDAEGLSGNNDAYCTTVYYEGVLGTGDLYSSFGGGNPWWSYATDTNGNKTAQFGGDTDNMQAYLQAMNNWYKNGWFDTKFEQRGSDTFYKINLSSFSEGKVGLGQMGMAYPGTTIRTTQHENKKTDAMLLGCALPINDKYGSDAQKFKTPDSMYAASKLGNSTGISTAALEKKDKLPALFTMLNWLYSDEGAIFTMYGLSEEQYNSMSFSNDYYKEYGITSAWYEENGEIFYNKKAWGDSNLQGALNGQRLATSLQKNSNKGNFYSIAVRSAMDEWKVYPNTTEITVYNSLMTLDQSNKYNKVFGNVRDYMDTTLPGLIKGYSDSGWNNYKSTLKKKGYSTVNDIYNLILAKVG